MEQRSASQRLSFFPVPFPDELLDSVMYRFSYGESMAFSHDKWLDADGMGDYLAQVPQREFGDVYARSIHE